MALTRRFGLNKFGGRLGGSLSDNGGKFSGMDRDTIDRLLAAFEIHHHEGGTTLASPTVAPTALVATSGGTLPAGTTFYYKFTLVDASGLETAASPEVSVITPAPVMPPSAPSVAADDVTGAQLGEGLYYYAISCVVDSQETPITTPTLITIAADRNAARLTLPVLPSGAQQFRVWRQRGDESGFSPIGYSAGGGDFVDDGSVAASACPTDPLVGPSPVNRTNSRNAITVSLPAGLTDVRWRLYRSTASGNFPSPSMVADVVQTTGENSGPIVNVYADLGGPTLDGAPQIQSQVLLPSARLNATDVAIAVPGAHTATAANVQAAVGQLDAALFATAGVLPVGATLPSVTGRPDGSPFVKTPEHVLYVVISGAWVIIGGSGGAPAIPDLVVRDVNGVAWQFAADDTGHLLLTTYSGGGTVRPSGSGPVLADAAAGNWRVEVDITGHASTVTSGTAEYAVSAGPTLASPTRTWRLGVDTTGHLALTSLS